VANVPPVVKVLLSVLKSENKTWYLILLLKWMHFMITLYLKGCA